MAKTIDPIRKRKYKRARLKGKTKKESLLKAGYTPTTAHSQNPSVNVIKCVEKEIEQELLAKDITVDFVIKQLKEDRELAKAKGDISTATRVDELMGKYIAMFTDKSIVDSKLEVSEKAQSTLDKYGYNRLHSDN